ncbi:sugar kinase [Kineococcus gynurae]|uniref:Sugar kinase n=1 Tax=Kineococcus gynurae TaxID=452979 RepID=A0ABV5LW61_9ACTN
MSRYVLTAGETMGLFAATTTGPLAHCPTATIGIGGSESNVAIGLARLGTEVVWCGRTGADSLGELVRRELRAEGVRVESVVDPDASTGLMVKERPLPTAQRVSYYRAGSAGSRLTPADVTDELVAGAAAVHLSGITAAISETGRATVRSVLDRAGRAGIPRSFDVNHRRALWSDAAAAEHLREVLPEVDLVFAGEDEARLVLPDESDPSALARGLVGLGARAAVVKCGERGAVACVDGRVTTAPAVPVPVLDTVGAGDAFVAGYLAEFVLGRPFAECLRTATTTGAFACTVPGDWEGLPRRGDLDLLAGGDPVRR